MAISFPFARQDPHLQPVQHGDHHVLHHPEARRSCEERRALSSTPTPELDTRYISSHYVEEIIEKAVDEQQLLEKWVKRSIASAFPKTVFYWELFDCTRCICLEGFTTSLHACCTVVPVTFCMKC